MCGRFHLKTSPATFLQPWFPEIVLGSSPDSTAENSYSTAEVDGTANENSESSFRPRYNIAPTQDVHAVVVSPKTSDVQLQMFRWGLLPSWAKELSMGSRMINARSETVESKPAFRRAFASQRCLIPTDGYYEWRSEDGVKQPYLIEPTDGDVLMMAGLWEVNRRIDPDNPPILTCAVLTTSANETTSEIHDRMPVFVQPSDFETWLQLQITKDDEAAKQATTERLKSLLRPMDEGLLTVRPVSRYVNSARNQGPECIAPMASN